MSNLYKRLSIADISYRWDNRGIVYGHTPMFNWITLLYLLGAISTYFGYKRFIVQYIKPELKGKRFTMGYYITSFDNGDSIRQTQENVFKNSGRWFTYNQFQNYYFLPVSIFLFDFIVPLLLWWLIAAVTVAQEVYYRFPRSRT